MFRLYPNLRLIALIEDYVALDFPLSLLMNQTACRPGILVELYVSLINISLIVAHTFVLTGLTM